MNNEELSRPSTRTPFKETYEVSFWNSLSTKLMLTNLGIFLISLATLMAFVLVVLHEDLERGTGERQFDTVSLMATEIEKDIKDRIGVLKKIASKTPCVRLVVASKI